MPIFFYRKCQISILHVEDFSELLFEKQKTKKRTNIIVHDACTQSFYSSAVKLRTDVINYDNYAQLIYLFRPRYCSFLKYQVRFSTLTVSF